MYSKWKAENKTEIKAGRLARRLRLARLLKFYSWAMCDSHALSGWTQKDFFYRVGLASRLAKTNSIIFKDKEGLALSAARRA